MSDTLKNLELENANLMKSRNLLIDENAALQRENDRLKEENQKLRDALVAKWLQ